MNDLASTINGGAIAMPDPEQMDRRLILKRAHQNSSGSSGSEPDSKNLRKRLNVGESGDSMRSSTCTPKTLFPCRICVCLTLLLSCVV